MTPRADKAVALNAKSRVVEAEWLTGDGRNALGPPITWKLFKVVFEDGSKVVLNREDKEALVRRGFRFRWLVEER